MRRFAILLVILFFGFTLVTVDSGGHQRNAIDTLYTTTTDSSNYTKNVLTHNSNFNATIVVPLTVNSTTAASASSSSGALNASSFAGSALAVQTFSDLTPVPTVIVSGADTSAAGFIATSKASSVLRDKRGTTLNPAEIARQNQITQQILSHYLERRLYPERVVAQKIPTIADILPKPTISTTTTTTTKPKQRGKARGFSISSSSRKKGSSGRKTYGQSKPLNSLYERKNIRKQEDKQSSTEDYPDEAELERNDEDNSGNKTLNNDRLQPYEDEEEFDDEEEVEFPVKRVEPSHSSSRHHQRYRQQHYVYHPFYRNRYYEDNIEQESLQSFESEQHDSLYRNREVALSRDPSENEIDSGK